MDKLLAIFSCDNPNQNVVKQKPIQTTPQKIYFNNQKNNEEQVGDQSSKIQSNSTTRKKQSTKLSELLNFDIEQEIQNIIKLPIQQRKLNQVKFIKKHLEVTSQMYMIQAKWSIEYTLYLKQQNASEICLMRPINNQNLSIKNKLKSTLIEKVDYYLMNKPVWILLRKLYGGGPQIKKYQQLLTHILPVNKLRNNSYYCYFNTGMQTLFSIGQFVYYFKNKLYNQLSYNTILPKKIFSSNTHKMINICSEDPKKIKDLFQCAYIFQQKFNKMYQQDCNQFLRYYLGILQDQNNPRPNIIPNNINTSEQSFSFYKANHPSIIDTLFYSQHTIIIECTRCGSKFRMFEAFLELTLAINHYTLQKCISEFFSLQMLQDLYDCMKCKQKTKARKHSYISHTSKYFMITLKRFLSNKNKNNKLVFYPHKLNLKEYYQTNTETSAFRLHSIIIHKGTLQQGHYYCICRRENVWYQMNDQRVKEASFRDILNHQAYILIYQRQKY